MSDLQAEQVSVLSLLVFGRYLQQVRQETGGISTRLGLQLLETEAAPESLSQRMSEIETDSAASLKDRE